MLDLSERSRNATPIDGSAVNPFVLLHFNFFAAMYLFRFRKYAPDGRLLFSRFCDTLGVLGMLDDTMIAERMFRAFDQNKDREVRRIKPTH